jgi:uncharacterized protein (TIGR03435 family)
VLCGILVLAAGFAPSQTGKVVASKFEVVSVKPCRGDFPPGARSGSNGTENSPGTLNLNCQTLKGLIQMAYVVFANGHVNPAVSVPITGGPSWIESERYAINAKAETATSPGIMRGPMLQALLEDRFGLKIRRESREVPVYALTVAKGGPKLPRFQEGSCVSFDFTRFPPEPALSQGLRYCRSLGSMKGPNITVEAEGTRLDDFCKFFLQGLDRPVIDRTGLAGKYNFHLVYAPDTISADPADPGTASDDPPGQSIFTALQQQLGLKLEATRGSAQFLVIDRVSRPSEN